MKVYVVKNTDSGKYVSSKHWYRPSLSNVPVLFSSKQEANELRDIAIKRVRLELSQLGKGIADAQREIAKHEKEVQKAVTLVERVKDLGDKKLIKEMERRLKTAKECVVGAHRYLAQEKASDSRASKLTDSFVVLPVQLP